VQGLRRYYALKLVASGKAQLVRELDGTHVLAEVPCAWKLYEPYKLRLEVKGDKLIGYVNGQALLRARDGALAGGALALLIEEGRLGCDEVEVEPAG